MGLEQSGKYLDVIRRFGRFPHRNQILGRQSTPEEEKFLETWNFEGYLTEFRSGKEHHRREDIGAELQKAAVA